MHINCRNFWYVVENKNIGKFAHCLYKFFIPEQQQPSVSHNCQSMEKGEEFTTLGAAVDKSFFAPPFCMVPSTENQVEQQQTALNYDVTVDVFCLTDTYSRIGIYFNAVDEKNYNFAYIQ